MWLPEGFIAGQRQRVQRLGPLPWSNDVEHPVKGITASERAAMRTLLKRGELEVDYDDKDNLVIRAPMVGPVKPKEAINERLGYAETPALIALRERRRRIGR